MLQSEFIDWIETSRNQFEYFIDKTIHLDAKSPISLTLSGDKLPQHEDWGLAQITFLLRIHYILNQPYTIQVDKLLKRITQFAHDGYIFDKALHKIQLGRRRYYKNALKFKPNYVDEHIAIAESRQAIATLLTYDYEMKKIYYKSISKTYLTNWKSLFYNTFNSSNPWGDSSYINHLIFFSQFESLERKQEITSYFQDWVSKNRNDKDYTFADKNQSVAMKIGSTMKVLMALDSLGLTRYGVHEKLVDFILESEANGDACELFNTVFILKQCAMLNYRLDEMKSFALNKVDSWKAYYHKNYGAFSFNEGKSSTIYYGFNVGKGFNEPDYHGSAMFYWGFLIVAEILGIKEELNLKSPIL